MRIKILSIVILLCSCSPTRSFLGGATANKLTPPVPGGVYAMTCNSENYPDETIKLQYAANLYKYTFSPLCPQKGVFYKTQDVTQPINIVIVMNTTSSMQDSLLAMKQGILNFSQGLVDRGWDPRISLMGFKDEIDEMNITDFLPAQSLLSAIGDWTASGGQGVQQGGQLALSLAYRRLVTFKQLNPDRVDKAQDLILYVANGVIYWDINKTYFRVDHLADIYKNWKQDLPNLLFYYSVANGLNPVQDKSLNAPLPLQQINDLVGGAQLNAQALDFPLSSQVLDRFQEELSAITQPYPFVCTIQEATLSSASSTSTLTNLYPNAFKGLSFVFQTAKDTKVSNYRMTITRCCKQKFTDPTCNFETTKLKMIFAQ